MEDINKNNGVLGTSAAGLSSPTTNIGNRSTSAKDIISKAKGGVLSSPSDSGDAIYKQGLMDLESQIDATRTQKLLSTEGALQSIGDLRNTIFDNERARREQQAKQGFIGGMGDIRQQSTFNRNLSATEQKMERGLLNKQRGANVQLGQLSEQELAMLRGTGAFNKELSRAIAKRQLSGQEGNLFDMSHDQGFFGTLGGWFGKDQTYSADLHADQLKGSEYFKNIFNELGVDMNDTQVMDKIKSALSKTVTSRQDRLGIFDSGFWTGDSARDHYNFDLGGDDTRNVATGGNLASDILDRIGAVGNTIRTVGQSSPTQDDLIRAYRQGKK